MRWPSTPRGKVVLDITAVYVAFWINFLIFPAWKETVTAAPYLGTALNVFFAINTAALIFWIVWNLLF